MTDEELVKRLREEAITLSGIGINRGSVDASLSALLAEEAADRIEQLINLNEALVELLDAARADAKEAEAYAEELEKERDRWKDRCRHLSGELDVVLAGRGDEHDRAEAAEAKLAKAVEVLVLCRNMFDEVAHPSDPMSVLLNSTLAELEGDKT
jgi:FtsZ-binding cell division protein ZapB